MGRWKHRPHKFTVVKKMTDFRRPLGDYVQLLLRHDLLADKGPIHADLTAPVALVSCDSQVVIPHTLFLCMGA